MKFRKLRITFSISCIIVCVILAGMWFGTYRGYERFGRPVIWSNITLQPRSSTEWELRSNSSQVVLDIRLPSPSQTVRGLRVYGFGWQGTWNDLTIAIPYWFLITVSAALATTPWIHWSRRFSLRTLLIVTTFLAAVLGLAVYPVLKK